MKLFVFALMLVCLEGFYCEPLFLDKLLPTNSRFKHEGSIEFGLGSLVHVKRDHKFDVDLSRNGKEQDNGNGNPQAGYVNLQPGNMIPQPGYVYPQPGYGYPQPGYGYPQPSYGYPQPGYGYPQPGYGYPQPEQGPGYPQQGP